MTRHSVTRTSRGTVARITGNCGADDCPDEDVDDDGGIEYTCPVTGETLAEVDAVDEPDTPDDRTPASIDDLTGDRRRRRRR